MKRGQINLRIDDSEMVEWQKKAEGCGKSLSAWIRERCNGLVVERTEVKVVAKSDNPGVRPVSDASVLQRGVVTAGGPVEPRKGGVCKHGTAKGYNCWQCGGIAKVGEG